MLAEHRRRIEAGANPDDEIVRMVRALPRMPAEIRDTVIAHVQELGSALPEARRSEVVGAWCASQGVSKEDFVWSIATAQADRDAPEMAEARRAFDAAVRARRGYGEALVEAARALRAAEPDATPGIDATALVPLGLSSAEEARRATERIAIESGWLAPQLDLIARTVLGSGPLRASPEADEVLSRVRERFSRPGAGLEDGIDAMLAALGPRPPGAPRSEIQSLSLGLGQVLMLADPARRAEIAARVYARAGWTRPEAIRAFVERLSLPEGALAAYDREAARGGPVAGLIALGRLARIDGLTEQLAFAGLLSPDEERRLLEALGTP